MSLHKRIYQKFLFYISMLGLVASVLAGFYDVLFGSVFEFLHLIFEVIEMALDRLVEETFHTELHETQMIVFYILLVMSAFVIYFVWKALVMLVASFSHGFGQDWMLLKEAVIVDWEAMPMVHKIIWVCAFLLFNYLISFLFF